MPLSFARSAPPEAKRRIPALRRARTPFSDDDRGLHIPSPARGFCGVRRRNQVRLSGADGASPQGIHPGVLKALGRVPSPTDTLTGLGVADLYYHPEYVVTRDQMAVYVAQAFDLPQ
jgi:hypothetical protein